MSLVQEMLHLEAYFKCHAESGAQSFVSLQKATSQINDLIGGSISLTSAELKEIVAIFNQTTEQTQASGAGWLDVRLHLTGLIRENGMDFVFEGQSLRLI
jgi:hypothetical protein